MTDPVTAASGADQPTLRDQLDVLRLMHASLPHDPRAGDPAFCGEDGKPWPCPTYEALPLIEADRERAKAEGGAKALHRAADWIVKTDFDRQHPDLFRAIADVLHAQARWSQT